MKKYNVKKYIDITFLFCSVLTLFCFCIMIGIKGQNDKSVVENRMLFKIPNFSFTAFFKGDYQKKLENSLLDQMIMGETIKSSVVNKKAVFTDKMQRKTVAIFYGDKKDVRYIPISNGIYRFGDSEHMLYKYINFEDYMENIKNLIIQYNKHFQNIDSYFYMVTDSYALDFNTPEYNPFYSYIENNLNFKTDLLRIDNYEKYKDLFYQTDHHWNYKGSYQGYKDIINMMLPGEEVLEPTEITTFDFYFYGSLARKTSLYNYKEKFTVYNFDLPEFKTYINGETKNYGKKELYYNKKCSTQKGVNHYAHFYGGDYAEVMFDYNQPEKQNLLVIAPSFSNAINDILASHFNKTYYIDLRYYKNEFGRDFNPEEYCKIHEIDKFLLCLNANHLRNPKFQITNVKERNS